MKRGFVDAETGGGRTQKGGRGADQRPNHRYRGSRTPPRTATRGRAAWEAEAAGPHGRSDIRGRAEDREAKASWEDGGGELDEMEQQESKRHKARGRGEIEKGGITS